MYKQPENQAYEVPLCERLDVVPLDARLIIEHKQPEALRLANVLDDDIRAHHEEAAAELRRLHHNNEILLNALWKACGDDKDVVDATIESQGELK